MSPHIPHQKTPWSSVSQGNPEGVGEAVRGEGQYCLSSRTHELVCLGRPHSQGTIWRRSALWCGTFVCGSPRHLFRCNPSRRLGGVATTLVQESPRRRTRLWDIKLLPRKTHHHNFSESHISPLKIRKTTKVINVSVRLSLLRGTEWISYIGYENVQYSVYMSAIVTIGIIMRLGVLPWCVASHNTVSRKWWRCHNCGNVAMVTANVVKLFERRR